MAARQLGLLSILGLENLSDTVEQLDIALSRIGFQGGNESPGHGASGFSSDKGIGTIEQVSVSTS